MNNTPKTDFTLRFNGFDLATIPYLAFSRRLTNDEAARDIISYNLVEQPGRIVTGVDIGDKALLFEGWIDAPNRDLYESALQQLQYYTQAVEKALDFQQAGRNVRFMATRNAIQQKPIEGGKATIVLQMLASQPYGLDLMQESQTFEFSSNTANDGFELDMNFLGNADAQPLFRITLNSVIDGENKVIMIQNPKTGTTVTIPGSFVAGDVIEVDTQRLSTTVNGEKQRVFGIYPEYRPNVEKPFYSDTFDARGVTIEVIYRRRYL